MRCTQSLVVKIVCVETVLTDDQKVWENVKDAKLNSPDYKGMAPEEVMEVRQRQRGTVRLMCA